MKPTILNWATQKSDQKAALLTRAMHRVMHGPPAPDFCHAQGNTGSCLEHASYVQRNVKGRLKTALLTKVMYGVMYGPLVQCFCYVQGYVRSHARSAKVIHGGMYGGKRHNSVRGEVMYGLTSRRFCYVRSYVRSYVRRPKLCTDLCPETADNNRVR